jgi:hypothetical protein
MKSFSEFIAEEEQKPVRLRLMPAIRHESGKIHTGKRGEDHSEIREKHMDENGPLKGEAGFYDPRERTFLTRAEAAKHAPRSGASGESTEFLTAAERDARKKRQEGGDSTDQMTDMQRMRKYGTFEEESLQEGNPLSRIARTDRASVLMSAERKKDKDGNTLTAKQNASRMANLKADWRERGYGFRKTEGKWDEGDGVDGENSIHVIAKGNSKDDAAELLRHTKELGSKHEQDSILYRSPGGKGTAIYTSDTKGGRKKGEKDAYGPSRYNVSNPYGETTFKTRKPEKSRPKLTFKPKVK